MTGRAKTAGKIGNGRAAAGCAVLAEDEQEIPGKERQVMRCL